MPKDLWQMLINQKQGKQNFEYVRNSFLKLSTLSSTFLISYLYHFIQRQKIAIVDDDITFCKTFQFYEIKLMYD